MMWRSSKIGLPTPSKAGIGILLLSSGEASGMPVATGSMPDVIGRADQGLRPNMCCHDVFVRYDITNGSAMPLQKASDPLVRVIHANLAFPIISWGVQNVIAFFSDCALGYSLDYPSDSLQPHFLITAIERKRFSLSSTCFEHIVEMSRLFIGNVSMGSNQIFPMVCRNRAWSGR